MANKANRYASYFLRFDCWLRNVGILKGDTMRRRKKPHKSLAERMPAGATIGIAPNAADDDPRPSNDTELVFKNESGEHYTAFDMSVLDGMTKPKR
jgi:hypothetical protein